ncbi:MULTISPECIES: amino acid ABC transporter substrate-binding protein [Pandoraea]|uniref:Glutamate/aspartate import solute-binding protein n=1 Tax=Pandoraea communis TaxID=2508297 RepID=A0A5E4U3W0_9BURK|nr:MULTISPECIES: amino acid ABC transporter substrate-binding protein [Pandoraea]EON12914.1 glutamate/aspartate ABC transporter substrate-binding protein [Pandoraea sp. SD6-2]VVD93544.1 Glutamate/aspartate import solute-binding protein [Pandoraea communis]
MNGFKEVNWKGVAKRAALGLTVWLAAQAAVSTAIAATTKADAPVVALPSVNGDLTGTLKKIHDTGLITLGYREAAIPFAYVNDKGKPVGYTMDLCYAVVDAVKTALNMPNLRVREMSVTPQNRIPLVKNGTVDLDCAPNTITPERAEQVGFSHPYYVSEVRLLVNKKDNIRGLDDLKGQNLVASAGSTGERLARLQAEKGGFRVIPARDHGESMMTLETGRAKAFALDDVLLAGLRATAREPGDFAIVGAPLETELNALMLRRDDSQFKRFVDTTLAHVFSSGEIRRIQRKWFQQPIPPRNVNLNLEPSKEVIEVWHKGSQVTE